MPTEPAPCDTCPKIRDALALTPDLGSLRALFFSCHDHQGNQIGWPAAGGLLDQSAETVYAFSHLRAWLASKTKVDAEGPGRSRPFPRRK
ncbi:MAG: hypothetical protein A2Y38_22390 [Spirochaetes bacterium GWB1_59_5]|nr:MAG: hypothetical protein A2Y38_22390 [Spirochaetes bacterium GWB1_59_5]